MTYKSANNIGFGKMGKKVREDMNPGCEKILNPNFIHEIFSHIFQL
jgi:hypothetical protein